MSAQRIHPAISAYNFFREASRCVLILENLALRGTFWPGSCAAVIRELQSALTTKRRGEASSGQQKPLMMGAPETPTIPPGREESSINPAMTTHHQHTCAIDAPENLPQHDVPTASPVFDSPFNQYSSSINTGWVGDDAIASNGFDLWPDMFGSQGAPGDYGDGSYDIFQLMDPSYLLRGQVTSSQPPEPVESFGRRMFFAGPAADHQER
jgi:hypothetical protein